MPFRSAPAVLGASVVVVLAMVGGCADDGGEQGLAPFATLPPTPTVPTPTLPPTPTLVPATPAATGAAGAAAEAAARTREVASGRVAASYSFPDGASFDVEAAFDRGRGRSRMVVDVAGGATAPPAGAGALAAAGGRVEMVTDGSGVFVALPPAGDGESGGGKRWAPVPDPTLLERFGIVLPERDPWLAALVTIRGKEEVLGSGTLDGEETTRYAVRLEPGGAAPGPVEPAEVWVGRDGLVRRISIAATDVTVRVDYRDLGRPVEIDVPTPGELQAPPSTAAPRP